MATSDDFKHITIVSVNGVAERVPLSLNALVLSANQLPGAKCLLVAPYLPETAPRYIQHVPITQLGYIEYSLFILYCLKAFIGTEFALIVQDDGWVLNGANWRSEYLNFDILGAPIHLARVHTPSGPQYMRGFSWVGASTEATRDVILNGGFSLRSRRALHAPANLGIPVQVPPVSQLVGKPYAMRFPNEQPFEDVQLCTFMRPQLEEHGIRFAPLAVARNFSFEHLAPGLHDGLDLMTVFGHHSSLRKLTSLDPLLIEYSIAESQVDQIVGERQIVSLLSKLGYGIKYRISPP